MARYDGSVPYSANARAACSLAPSASAVTATGRPTTTRGAGLPAFSAAVVMEGTMWPPTVAGPVIQVTVPSANRPASRSMTGARAARSTGGWVTPFTSSGPNVFAFSVSPSKLTCSPRRPGSRADRYSRMWRAGRSKE